MPTQNELMWSCSNNYDTEVSYKKGTTVASANQGVCAGLAIEWCKNILQAKRPELSKPFLLQGMLYQRFYDWGTSDATRNANLFDKAGVSQQSYKKRNSARGGASELWGKVGAYWGGYNNHAISVCKMSDQSPQLFFDPNFGCYTVHSQQRLAELIRQGRNAVGAANWVEFYGVSLN